MTWNDSSAVFILYPRFILLDRTQISLGKHVSQELMISVRQLLIRPSVRPSIRIRALSQPTL